MDRRNFLGALTGGSLALMFPASVRAARGLPTDGETLLQCLGHAKGFPFLDGRTRDGTVGLIRRPSPELSGARWKIISTGDGTVALQCRGAVHGPCWLDGRTANGTVGLAPHRNAPFSGTRWQVIWIDAHDENVFALKCLGSTNGSRFLDGRTGVGSVGLAPSTQAPFTGTRWKLAKLID
jgi:hypothetical protein